MKIKTFILSILLALPMWVLADDCTTIWTGNIAITNGRDATLYLDHTLFSTAQAGNKLILNGERTGDGDHKFYFGDWDYNPLKGSIICGVGSFPVEIFLTEDMLTNIGTNDLRIYGEGLTLTSIELCSGKAGNLHFGKTIWTGYFWIDNTTLQLCKEAIPADLSGYKALRIFHEANRTDISFNLIKDDWEGAHKIADQNDMVKTNTYFDLPLTDAIKTGLTSLTTQLNIQGFKNEGDAFNMTDVILIPNDPCDNCFYYQY